MSSVAREIGLDKSFPLEQPIKAVLPDFTDKMN